MNVRTKFSLSFFGICLVFVSFMYLTVLQLPHVPIVRWAILTEGLAYLAAGVFAIRWIRLWLCACGHAGENGEVRLHLGPSRGIFFCGDGQIKVGVVALHILFDPGRDGLRGLAREFVQQVCIGGVGQRVAAWLYDASSIEVAI